MMSCCRNQVMSTIAAFAVAVIAIGTSTYAIATVILTTDRSLFLSSNSIVSTETFDEFAHPTQFPVSDQSVTIDLVTYFDPTPAPGWSLDQISITSSPPNSLFTRNSLADKTITFESGFVRAFGFQFIAFVHAPGADARFHFLVSEIDGSITDFLQSPPNEFLGFSSSVGIRSMSVIQERVQGVLTNFAFDDVSRSPEPGTLILMSVGLVAAVLAKRRSFKKPDPHERTGIAEG